MARLMPMPEVAAASGSAGLQAWLVEVGQAFTAGEAIAVIETDKAVVDLEADADGVLLQLLAQPGTDVQVGDPIAVVGAPGETADSAAALLASLRAHPDAGSPLRRDDLPRSTPPAEAAPAAHRVFSSPLARRLAREAGLHVSDIDGTGPNGRIVRRDVEAAVAIRQRDGAASPTAVGDRAVTSQGPAAPSPAAPSPAARSDATRSPAPQTTSGAGFVTEPHSRMRRAIASRLSASTQTVPHFYLRGSCRVDALLALRAQLNDLKITKISVNDLVVKAAAGAHRAVPDMNVQWTDEALLRFATADIAIAVATDNGLLTPVLRGLDRMSVSEIALSARDLIERAKTAQLRQSELEGGSMTVTNLGRFGTHEFGAIINPPQAAILAVGAAIRAPVVVGERIEVGTIMNVTLSVDHRSVDGVVAARWMQAFVRLVEEPLHLLI